MSPARPSSEAPRSRSHLLERSKVKNSVYFHVWSITLSFLDGFQNYFAEMLTIIRQCVMCKTQVHSSKDKVTLRGQRSKIESIFRVRSVAVSPE